MLEGSLFSGKAIVVTGGTRGIGLEIALQFARLGAQTYITYFMGSADPDDVDAQFDRIGAKRPIQVRCNAGNPEETRELVEQISRDFDRVEAWIANVSVAQLVRSVKDYQKRSFLQSIEMSAWPLVDAVFAVKEKLNSYPRYVVGLSSVGTERYVHNYDFMAAAKNSMESLCKYLTCRLIEEDIRINIIRAGVVDSSSLKLTFGPDYVDFANDYGADHQFVPASDIAKSAIALCSGYMDSVKGEVIRVDGGAAFYDPFMRKYSRSQTSPTASRHKI